MSCCKPTFPKKHIIGEYDSTWLDLVHFESEPLVMFAISLHAHRNMIQFWLGRQTLWAHADGRHKTASVTETVTRTQGPNENFMHPIKREIFYPIRATEFVAWEDAVSRSK